MPDNEEHSLHQATIVSRAGKSTGKYCNWYNVQFALPESKSGQATALDLGKYWSSLSLKVQIVHQKCTVYLSWMKTVGPLQFLLCLLMMKYTRGYVN